MGFFESSVASDGSSQVTTRYLKWDKLTGNPVLHSVSNNFDDPVFTYSVPAYSQYVGMGAAYKNAGLMFSITSVQKDALKNDLYQFFNPLQVGVLCPGDEILLYGIDSNFDDPIALVVYNGLLEDDDMIYTSQPLTATEYKCKVIRSGYRNQLSVMAGSVTALQDPSLPGQTVTYTKQVPVPKF